MSLIQVHLFDDGSVEGRRLDGEPLMFMERQIMFYSPLPEMNAEGIPGFRLNGQLIETDPAVMAELTKLNLDPSQAHVDPHKLWKTLGDKFHVEAVNNDLWVSSHDDLIWPLKDDLPVFSVEEFRSLWSMTDEEIRQLYSVRVSGH